MSITTEYRKARAERGGTRAIDALRIARHNERMRGIEFPRYVGDDVRIDLPRGEYIICKLEYDHGSDIRERLGCDWDSTSGEYLHAEMPLGWMDREGRVLFDADPRGYRVDWAWWDADTAGWTLADRIAQRRQQGMARHDAWLSARESIRREFDYFREVYAAGYVGYVVTLYGADDNEVEHDSCWGFEAVGDYAGHEARSVADHMADERAKHWERETAKAREAMRAAGRAFSDLTHEYRKARTIGPATCDAIRARMESLRAQHRAALAVIVGGKA